MWHDQLLTPPFPPEFIHGRDKKWHAGHGKTGVENNIFRIVGAFKSEQLIFQLLKGINSRSF